MKVVGFLVTPIAVSATVSPSRPVLYTLSMSHTATVLSQDCSEWMLRPMFDPAMKKGAFHLDNHADPVPARKLYLDQEAQTAVYNHFIEEASKY